jgi:hypothetical protein
VLADNSGSTPAIQVVRNHVSNLLRGARGIKQPFVPTRLNTHVEVNWLPYTMKFKSEDSTAAASRNTQQLLLNLFVLLFVCLFVCFGFTERNSVVKFNLQYEDPNSRGTVSPHRRKTKYDTNYM